MANEKRLIDANLEISYLRTLLDENQNFKNTYSYTAFECVLHRLENAPTVDAVEVVHGRWIDNLDENGFLCNAWRKCSACGGLNYSKRPPYCPNCGAKMDGGNEDG